MLHHRTVGLLVQLFVCAFVVLGPGVHAQDGVQAQRLRTFDEAWRIVRDSHFDPGMNGVDWEAVRAELRPKAAAATTDEALREIIRDMVGRLNQSHFYVIGREALDTFDPDLLSGTDHAPAAAGSNGSFGDVGLDVRLVDRQVLVSRIDPAGPAAMAGVRPGWVVARIEGRDMASSIEALPAEIDKRRASVQIWGLASGLLHGKPGTKIRMAALDADGQDVRLTLTRREEPGAVVQFGNLPPYVARLEAERLTPAPGVTVGVIRFNVWMLPLAAQFDRAVNDFRGDSGIVLDLRGNPGGIAGMIMGFAGHFLDAPISLGTMRMRNSELRFVANPRKVTAEGVAVTPFGGPVAILVDNLSHSASEVFAGGMQSIKRARVFGQTTVGGVLPALFDRLPNGDVLGHAFAEFITADGTRLEGRGVIPDEVVPLSRTDLLAGRDAPLQAAMEWIARAKDNQTAPPGRIR